MDLPEGGLNIHPDPTTRSADAGGLGKYLGKSD